MQSWCCRCLRIKKHDRFFSAMNKVEHDIAYQIDMVSIVRRLRMHGFALYSIMGQFDRKNVSRMAQRKSVNLIRDSFPEFDHKDVLSWADLEHISVKEMMQLKILDMFKKVVAREQEEQEKKSKTNKNAPKIPHSSERDDMSFSASRSSPFESGESDSNDYYVGGDSDRVKVDPYV